MSERHEDALRIALPQVARVLGIARTRDGRLTPCPGCGAKTRSERDGRPGPVFLICRETSWKCGRCGRGGDALDLVATVLCGTPYNTAAVPAVHAWFEARGLGTPVAGRKEQDHLGRFIDARCEFGPFNVKMAVLYESYLKWHEEQAIDDRPLSKVQVGLRLSAPPYNTLTYEGHARAAVRGGLRLLQPEEIAERDNEASLRATHPA